MSKHLYNYFSMYKMDVYIVTEAQERLRRVENEEDIQKICEEIIYDPYENKEILIKMISIVIEKLKHYTEKISWLSVYKHNIIFKAFLIMLFYTNNKQLCKVVSYWQNLCYHDYVLVHHLSFLYILYENHLEELQNAFLIRSIHQLVPHRH